MDTEYQYETFNGLPVYYGADKYDSDDSEGFFLDTPEERNNRMRNQRRDIVCDGNMLSRAPEFKIGLVNDIMCGLIYVNI